MSLFSRTDRSALGRWWWTIDRPILFTTMTLIVIGILMVATASPPVAEHLGIDPFHFLKRHIIMLVPAVAIMLATSMLPPRQLWRLSSLLFIGTVIAMILVLIMGAEIKGARRWIHFAGFSLQPSEFMKPIFAIISAWFLSLQKKHDSFTGVIISTVIYALTVTLLMMQPDFGMTFVITLIWCAQIFIAGLPLRYVAIMIGFLAAGVAFVYVAFDHVQSRIDRFLNPQSGDNYQVEQSVEAFRQGGFIGKGPGQGEVKLNLPDAHADFIFSVAGEEMGLIFALFIIACFATILVRGFNRLMDQDDIFTVLAGGGILTMMGVQAFIHMGSALNILPAKGMTLPFVSYGGSSTIAIGFAMGAIIGLTKRGKG
jgi:cell division protein FtsW